MILTPSADKFLGVSLPFEAVSMPSAETMTTFEVSDVVNYSMTCGTAKTLKWDNVRESRKKADTLGQFHSSWFRAMDRWGSMMERQ